MMRHELEFALHHGTNYLKQQVSYRLEQPLNKPTTVGIAITNVCAARCMFCDIWKLQSQDELTAAQWIEFLGRMREWLGPFWLSIAGGEPFQKPGIFDVLKFCRENRIKTKMSSNGFLLRRTYLDRILEYGPDFLSLSIDSVQPEKHDTWRGRTGMHARCAEALHYLRARSAHIVLGVAAIVMEDNYHELPALARWAVEQGADRVNLLALLPHPGGGNRDPQWWKKTPQWVQDSAAFDGVVDELLAMKHAGVPIWNEDGHLEGLKAYYRNPYAHPRPDECAVRYDIFNVDPYGNVNLCWTVGATVGRVLEQHPAEIWRSHQAAIARDKMRPCRRPCMMLCSLKRSLGSQVNLFRFFMERQGF